MDLVPDLTIVGGGMLASRLIAGSLLLVFVGSLTGCGSDPQAPETATDPRRPSTSIVIDANVWVSAPSLTQGRFQPGVASDGGRIYVFGGVTQLPNGTQPIIRSVELYDPVANAWSSGAPLPRDLLGIRAAGPINGKIYLIDGKPANLGMLIYDIGTNSWSGVHLPFTVKAGGAAAVINNRLYYSHPCTVTNCKWTEMREYDPNTGIWTRKKPLRLHHHIQGPSAVVNGRFYLMGGQSGGALTQRVDVYDPVADSWQTVASTPIDPFGAAGTGLAGKVYLVGGKFFRTVWIYDPLLNAWTQGPDMMTARYLLGLAQLQGSLYAIGGLLPPTALSSVEAYQP
jgi:hypothetical protein